VPSPHAIVADEDVLISSSEPLSDSATDATARRHEYGLLVRGADPAAAVVERLRH